MKAAQSREAREVGERYVSMQILPDEFENQLRLRGAQATAVRCPYARPVELESREFDRRCQPQCFAVSGIDRIGIDQQPLKLAQRGSQRRIIEIQHRPLDAGDPRIQFLRKNCRIVIDGGE